MTEVRQVSFFGQIRDDNGELRNEINALLELTENIHWKRVFVPFIKKRIEGFTADYDKAKNMEEVKEAKGHKSEAQFIIDLGQSLVDFLSNETEQKTPAEK